jgi:hypothetical protein
VSCTSAAFCMAVDPASALAWNGSSWNTPVKIDGGSNLGWVSCGSASFCVAVENYGNATTIWNGSSWSAQTDIEGASGTFVNRLGGISCASPSFCVAVSQAGAAITWSGSSWSAPASVSSGGFTGVSCASGSFCAGVSSGGQALTYAGAASVSPVLAQSVAAATVSGRVLVERRGTHGFVPLAGSTLIPVGLTVNTPRGEFRLTAAAAAAGHATHICEFHGGEFKLGQARSGLASLTLAGGAACAASAATTKSAKPPHRRSLWGDGHGSFETVGDYAAATDLGTRWLTRDTCTGTLVRVSQGTVRVTNLLTHSSFPLSAPHSYLARP